MSRRRRAEKRKTIPDPKFNSEVLGKFIKKVMLDGKKALAERIIYEALNRFAKKVNKDNQLEAFGVHAGRCTETPHDLVEVWQGRTRRDARQFDVRPEPING